MTIIYRPPRLGISQSEALSEAYASAKTGTPELLTVALYHPTFVEEDGTTPSAFYFVNDFTNLMATVEDDAPLHAGLEREFLAVPFKFTRPEENDGSPPEVVIEIDAASSYIIPYLNAAASSQDPVEMIVRIYLESDTSAPHEMPVMRLTIKGASADANTVRCVAGYGDLVNRKFPRIEYTSRTNPGLTA